jgi:hypothetical protein
MKGDVLANFTEEKLNKLLTWLIQLYTARAIYDANKK